MKKLPKHIIKKIERFVKLYNQQIGIIIDINKWKPELEDLEIEPERWQWDLYFRGSPMEITKENIERKILEALKNN